MLAFQQPHAVIGWLTLSCSHSCGQCPASSTLNQWGTCTFRSERLSFISHKFHLVVHRPLQRVQVMLNNICPPSSWHISNSDDNHPCLRQSSRVHSQVCGFRWLSNYIANHRSNYSLVISEDEWDCWRAELLRKMQTALCSACILIELCRVMLPWMTSRDPLQPWRWWFCAYTRTSAASQVVFSSEAFCLK